MEVMGKKKRNVDKDNLDGTSDGLQINQNWIRKKMDEVKEDGDETTVIFNWTLVTQNKIKEQKSALV